MLTSGATPDVDLEEWEFTIETEQGVVRQWSWAQFRELPSEEITVDINCVTHWTRLGTKWRGVSLDVLFDDVQTELGFAMAHTYTDYTSNIPLDELLDGQAWVAFEADGTGLTAEHGGPARLLVPHLYFWKSAKWVRGIRLMSADAPGFWESRGYNIHGDPLKEERYW